MGCGCGGCESLNTGILPTGATGATGATGVRGTYGGFSSDWVFSTSIGSGPASTNIRLNSATYSAVTTIYISNVNSDAIDVTNFLLSFTNNSKYGYIRLFKETDNTVFWYGQITALVNNVTEIVLTVTYFDANSTFSAADPIVVTFSPSGSGSSFTLSNNTTDVATSGAGTDALMTYTIPANTLKTNEDVIEIDASFVMSDVTQNKNLSFSIAGVNFISKLPTNPVANTFEIIKTAKFVKVIITITRKSTLAVYINVSLIMVNTRYQSMHGYNLDEGTGAGYAVADLSTTALVFACFGSNYDAVSNTETITQNQLLVKYFNK